MKARSFDQIRKDAGVSDVHVPGGGGGNRPSPRRARSFKQIMSEARLLKAHTDQPRDKNGRWTSGGSVTAEFASTQTAHGTLNGVAFASWKPPTDTKGWAEVEGQDHSISEPPFADIEGKHAAAGVIIKEPDGRIWLVKPSNGYGGYKATFPKGTQDEGLSLQATAIKEAYEESGLKVKITGFAGDVERDTSKARYYFAERVGGTPSDHGLESEGVVLAPPGKAHDFLNRAVDRQLAHDHAGAPKPPPEVIPTGWHQGGPKHFEVTWGGSPKGTGHKMPQYGSAKSSASMQAAVDAAQAAHSKPAKPGAMGSWAGMPKAPSKAPKGSTGYQSVFDFPPKLKKGASFADLVAVISPRAKSFEYVRKSSPVSGNLCRGPDGKYTACGIGGEAPTKKPKLQASAAAQEASNAAHAKVTAAAHAKGLPAPSKALGSPSNMSGHLKGEALLNMAHANDLAGLKSFIDKNASAKQSYTKAHVAFAQTLLAHKEGQNKSAASAAMAKPAPAVDGLKDTSGWKKVGAQLGSNPGGVYEDHNGQKWYVKQSKSDDHAKAEHLAGLLYAHAGVTTTRPELVNVGDGKLGIATKWVDKQAFDKNSASHVTLAQHDFAVHAWLANHDAVGAAFDNQALIPHASGTKVVGTVDVGGSLMYRAQGEPKAFGITVPEWDTMRDPKIAPQASAVFGSMTAGQLEEGAKKIGAMNDAHIIGLVMKHGPGDEAARKQLAQTLLARKEFITAKGEAIIHPPSAPAQATTPKATPQVPAMPGMTPMGAKPPRAPKPLAQQAPAIPNKPDPSEYGSAANAPNKKLIAATDAMHEAAVKYANGTLSQADAHAYISSFQFGSQTFHKKAAKFQNALLASIGGQGKPAMAIHAPEAASSAKSGKGKFDPTQISAPPSFKNWGGSGSGGPSKNQAINNANEKAVQSIHAAAKMGDPAAVKALMLDVIDPATGTVKGQQSVLDHPSQWVKGYATQVMQEIEYQKNPPKQFRFTDSNPMKALSSAYPVNKAVASVDAASKLGNYVVLGTPGTITPEAIGLTPKMPTTSTFSAAFTQAWSKIPATQQQALISYTGSGYASQNSSLWTGNPNGKAKAAAEAIQTHGHEVTPGTILSRKISLHGAEMQKLQASVGKVLQEPAISSTSVSPSVWGGNVHYKMTVGPGVKGLYIASESHHGSEKELLLPPNTRMIVTKIEKTPTPDKDGFGGHGMTTAHVIILPNEKGL